MFPEYFSTSGCATLDTLLKIPEGISAGVHITTAFWARSIIYHFSIPHILNFQNILFKFHETYQRNFFHFFNRHSFCYSIIFLPAASILLLYVLPHPPQYKKQVLLNSNSSLSTLPYSNIVRQIRWQLRN